MLRMAGGCHSDAHESKAFVLSGAGMVLVGHGPHPGRAKSPHGMMQDGQEMVRPIARPTRA